MYTSSGISAEDGQAAGIDETLYPGLYPGLKQDMGPTSSQIEQGLISLVSIRGDVGWRFSSMNKSLHPAYSPLCIIRFQDTSLEKTLLCRPDQLERCPSGAADDLDPAQSLRRAQAGLMPL